MDPVESSRSGGAAYLPIGADHLLDGARHGLNMGELKLDGRVCRFRLRAAEEASTAAAPGGGGKAAAVGLGPGPYLGEEHWVDAVRLQARG